MFSLRLIAVMLARVKATATASNAGVYVFPPHQRSKASAPVCLRNQSSVSIWQHVDSMLKALTRDRSVTGAGKIHFIFREDRMWLEIGFDP